ncbi:MAG TPA: SMP-30/gluconolactonase/LRE family protein [Pyrinomonadaceae bacterium]|jgi:sugar lactone lactonase YvrE/enterochelin esterase-like enzyme|nr:SMP-30/gluconolactonase/LRE family protein [Pyrinomonadaceae bacterium]
MIRTCLRSLIIAIVVLAWQTTFAQITDNYQPGPDSKPQSGVPKGEVIKLNFDKSKIFPDTARDYWIYIPAQYNPDKPACVFICQDGIRWEAPTVFDNLIYKKEIPITIGVFVAPGVVKTANANGALDRFNRSFEYDGLGDGYARFLLDELLPEVETKKTSDGRVIRLSHEGNDRLIAGASSGAIAAFTAAWERPDAFTRVFSSIGTFVDLRGGMRYPSLIRRYEPKPIRVFLQDGSGDLNIYGGDWWMANQTMERALVFAGYEVEHVWGDGGHTGKHATAIFPDALRWLWKDWPKAVAAHDSKNETLTNVLIRGEGWQLVSEGYKFTEGPAVNANGEVFFNDVTNSKTYKIGLDNKTTEFVADSKKGNGAAFGPDGRLYVVASGAQKVLAYDPNGKMTVIAEGFVGNDLVVANNGNVYVTNPPADNEIAPSKVWLIKPNGEKLVVDTGLKYANGVTLSPDQTLLYVADYRSHWVYSFVIRPDGTLTSKQRFFWLLVPDTSDQSNADGLRVDRDGRLYVATAIGIQICDQAGRVQSIIPTPNRRLSNLTFGGGQFDTLYATCGDRIYKRKLKVKGAQAWDKPIKPAPPRL